MIRSPISKGWEVSVDAFASGRMCQSMQVSLIYFFFDSEAQHSSLCIFAAQGKSTGDQQVYVWDRAIEFHYMGRIFAIGDIHGCLVEFNDLIALIDPDPTDRIVLLGDLINKGPDSLGVLRRAQSLQNCLCICGNHEYRLLRYRETNKKKHLKNSDYQTVKQLDADDWAFLETFHKMVFIEEHNTVLVHGGFVPNRDWQQQSVKMVTHIQNFDPDTHAWGMRAQVPQGVPWAEFWSGPPFVVYGHTARDNVFRRPMSIGIDTSCVYGGHLTAYEITEKKLFQVAATECFAARNRGSC